MDSNLLLLDLFYFGLDTAFIFKDGYGNRKMKWNWKVRHNKKIVDHYNSTLALNRIRYSERVHDNEVIGPRFQLLLQLKVNRVLGTTKAAKIKGYLIN